MVEIVVAGGACVVTLEIGCIPGVTEVAVDFFALYNTTPLNTTETVFSFLSAAFTISADWYDDREFGEPTHTAITTVIAGSVVADPAIDGIIDSYGMGYAMGICNEIDTILNGGSICKKK